MMRKALTVYETYVEMMNDDIRKVFQVCERCGTCLLVWIMWDFLVVCTVSIFRVLDGVHLQVGEPVGRLGCVESHLGFTLLLLPSPAPPPTPFQERNPFEFRHVTHLNSKHTHNFDDTGPCVLMATPSGLQSGVSRCVVGGSGFVD